MFVLACPQTSPTDVRNEQWFAKQNTPLLTQNNSGFVHGRRALQQQQQQPLTCTVGMHVNCSHITEQLWTYWKLLWIYNFSKP